LNENISNKIMGNNIDMDEEFILFLKKNNKEGSRKASSYIRALELLDGI
jgi:hypothetical protein